MQQQAFNCTLQQIGNILEKEYSIVVEKMTELGGFTDRNILIIYQDYKHVCKISSKAQISANLKVQNFVIQLLQKYKADFKLEIQFPMIIKTTKGQGMTEISTKNSKSQLRLFNFIEGAEVWNLEEKLDDTFYIQVGENTAKLVNCLDFITNLEIMQPLLKESTLQSQRFHFTDFSKFYAKYISYIQNQKTSELIHSIYKEFQELLPSLLKISKQIIHNDISNSNLLVSKSDKNQLIGIIDFWSIDYCHSLVELAVACARSTLCLQDPLKYVILIATGYNKVRKLEYAEKKMLYSLIKSLLSLIYLNVNYEAMIYKEKQYVQRVKQTIEKDLCTIGRACNNIQFQQRLDIIIKEHSE